MNTIFRPALDLWPVLLLFECYKQIPTVGTFTLIFQFKRLLIHYFCVCLNRPNVDQVLSDDFMTQGYMPSRLPLSCLTMPPRFDPRLNNSIIAVRRPLGEINRESPLISNDVLQGNEYKTYRYFPQILTIFHFCKGVKNEPVGINSPATADTPFPAVPSGPSPQQLLRDLQQQLYKLFASKPTEKVPILMGM